MPANCHFNANRQENREMSREDERGAGSLFISLSLCMHCRAKNVARIYIHSFVHVHIKVRHVKIVCRNSGLYRARHASCDFINPLVLHMVTWALVCSTATSVHVPSHFTGSFHATSAWIHKELQLLHGSQNS